MLIDPKLLPDSDARPNEAALVERMTRDEHEQWAAPAPDSRLTVGDVLGRLASGHLTVAVAANMLAQLDRVPADPMLVEWCEQMVSAALRAEARYYRAASGHTKRPDQDDRLFHWHVTVRQVAADRAILTSTLSGYQQDPGPVRAEWVRYDAACLARHLNF